MVDGASHRGVTGRLPLEAERFPEEARERLERADRLAAIGTLAAGLVHDIRNPLVSVRTFIQLLPERLEDEEFRTKFRELALAEIDRICALINDLLSFSRPVAAEREPTDLAEAAEQMVRLLEAEARKSEVELTSRTATESVRTVADAGQVRQVLMNVVLNALEACQPGGHVQVATRHERNGEGAWAVLEIGDTGHGLGDIDRERMFDAFYTTKSLGSGLGLFIARRIVVDHGGRIEAAPRDGGGTIFRIRLPACAEREDEQAVRA
jgi:polar amino acid transport system substrate-binding protein